MLVRFIFLLLCLLAAPAQAAMTIEIVGGAANRIPIAILPFALAPELAVGTADPALVVAGDLGRSGYFKLLDSTAVTGLPAEPESLQLAPWKELGADAVVVGQVRPRGSDRIEVRFWLFDPVRQTRLSALSYTTTQAGLRAVAHRISDAVHQALLGEPGAYGGRIAYILKHRGHYELQVADADSQNAVTVTSSPEPLISPAWSPDGVWPMSLSRTRSRSSMCRTWPTATAGRWRSFAARIRRPPGRRMAAALPWPCPRTRLHRSIRSTC